MANMVRDRVLWQTVMGNSVKPPVAFFVAAGGQFHVPDHEGFLAISLPQIGTRADVDWIGIDINPEAISGILSRNGNGMMPGMPTVFHLATRDPKKTRKAK